MTAPGTSPFPEDFSVLQLEGWLAHREKAVEIRNRIKAFERGMEEAEADRREGRDSLVRALAAASVPHDAEGYLDALLGVARSALDREGERRAARSSARESVEGCERDTKTRTRDQEAARKADREWAAKWDGILLKCWFGKDRFMSMASVRRFLTRDNRPRPDAEQTRRTRPSYRGHGTR